MKDLAELKEKLESERPVTWDQLPDIHLYMGPVTFILPVRRQLAVTLGGFALFYVLVLKFKNPVCWSHELFEAFTALFLALIVIILMMQLRVQSDSLKTKYYDLSRLDGLTGVLNKSAGLAAADHYLAAMLTI